MGNKEKGAGTEKEKLGSANISRIWMLGEAQGCQASGSNDNVVGSGINP